MSQTEGEPIESLDAMRPELLSGDAPAHIWHRLVALANANCFEVIRHQKGSENGYCDFTNLKIAVRPEVEPLQAVKTLVHELAHALLHADDHSGDRDRQEVEAESTAFVVLDALNLGSDAYSFPHVARGSGGDTEGVGKTVERSIRCASQILKALDLAGEVAAPSAGEGTDR